MANYEPNLTAPADLYIGSTTYGEMQHLLVSPDAVTSLCGVRVTVLRSKGQEPIPANDHWLAGPLLCKHCKVRLSRIRN